MNSTVKTIIFWVFIFACLVVLWQVFQKSAGTGKDQEIAWSEFLQDAQQGQVSDVTVTDSEVHGHLRADKGSLPRHRSGELSAPVRRARPEQGEGERSRTPTATAGGTS